MERIQNMKSADRIKHWEEFMASINDSTSTQDSKFTPREQILRAKGQEYQAHRQELRILQEKEQLSLSPFRPTINSSTNSSQNYSKVKVENRLLRYGQLSESRLEKKRKEKLKNEEIQQSFTRKSAGNKNLPEKLINQQKLVEKKLEMQRMQKIEQETNGNKSPELCKKSEEIVQKMQRTEKVEDRLYNSAKNFHEKVRAKQYLEGFNNYCNSKPVITEYAKRMNRDGNVTDRLMRYKDYYSEHLKELEDKYHRTPSTSPSRSNLAARERLLKPKSPAKSPEKPEFHPKISPNSKKLAKNLGNSSERLLKPTSPTPKVFEEPDCYFQPIINKNSEKFDNRKHSGERWESLYIMKDLIKDNREKLVESFNTIDPECTFKPRVKTQRDRVDQEKLVDRLNGWKTELEGRVAVQRKNMMEDELKNCTFSPNVKSAKNQKQISPKIESRIKAYSKKYKEVSASEFLNKLEELHLKLHTDY